MFDYIEVLNMIGSISEITRLWSRVLSKIQNKLNDSTIFSSIFDDSYINDIKGDTLYISVNSSLAAQLMRTKYADLISEAISEVTESNFKAEFLSPAELVSEVKTAPVAKKKSQFFQNAVLNSNLTFDNFVVGTFNREASQAALLVSRNPGKMFNPLFIHSNSGLGKTHLLHAIGNSIIRNGNPNAKILYITGQDFVEQYVNRIDNDHVTLRDIGGHFKIILDRLQRGGVTEQAHMADLDVGHHAHHAVDHAETGAEDGNDSQLLAGDALAPGRSNRSFDDDLLQGQIAGRLIAHEHGDLRDELAEFFDAGALVAEDGQLMLNQRVVENTYFAH